MSRLQLAIEQIVFARNYTIGLLDQTPRPSGFDSLQAASATSPGRWAISLSPSTDWRSRASEGRSPKTMPCSHRNSSVCLGRIRCRKQTRRYPPGEIRAVLNRVHEQVLRELPGLDETELDQPVPHPHPFGEDEIARSLVVR